MMFNLVTHEETLEFEVYKLCAIVYNEGFQYSESGEDIPPNKLSGLCCHDGRKWLCLYLLSEMIDGYN